MSPRRLAASCLALVGVIHLVLSPEYLEEEAYIGVLFILGGLAAVAAAVRLWQREDALAWTAGALICAGMGAGFVLSRTTGLPGFHESEWELSGVVCLVLEAAFLVTLAAARSRSTPHPSAA